ncbi:GNAT family N-acetyltransferase [Modestobacter sp. VKM Ac-2978]|uniref:GNAT family N-acetyltransferase n=1 Tax=Modestobacter sp. VKM Ac-2978 TaxID=3004132 RepID=UPI0022AB1B73|nr:GNAT family N-acetyltransferase [Modestobacter sp. VKM Ac-2978]MCZ2850083.1 GNAT family N-acetyltransferase [Modestobacter sp. VKM Ac-2978]
MTATAAAEQLLPGGLLLRSCRPGDLAQVGALLSDRGEPADALDQRLVVEDPDTGWDATAVVVDGDRVVSTATLLAESVRLEDVVLPAGQVELVATDPAYEGRGLVRALMAWAHDRSAARGDLLQVMIGIPYFYRLFGYEYAIDVPPARPVRSLLAPAPGLRPATSADLPTLARLQDAAQAGADVAMPHPAARLRWLVAQEASTTWVLERDGAVVASARVPEPDDDVLVAEPTAVDDAAATGLLAGVAALAAGRPVRVTDRPGSLPGRAWADRLGDGSDLAEQYYVRVPEPGALLEALRPVLGRRVAAAGADRGGHDVVVSTYRASWRLPVTDDGLGPVVPGGRLQAPGTVRGAGVAPDQLGALLFGPHGMHGLSRRRPDVYPGRDADFYAALFPPLRADLLTYYLPS